MIMAPIQLLCAELVVCVHGFAVFTLAEAFGTTVTRNLHWILAHHVHTVAQAILQGGG